MWVRWILFIALLLGLGRFHATSENDHRSAKRAEVYADPAQAVESADAPQKCATGCAAAGKHPAKLSDAEIQKLLERFGRDGLSENSAAVDSLLFHGRSVVEFLTKHRVEYIDPKRLDFLKRELSRAHARLSVRVVDEQGVERVRLRDVRVPLDVKQHLHADETVNMQPPEISGTVRRVGLDHLWTRL